MVSRGKGGWQVGELDEGISCIVMDDNWAFGSDHFVMCTNVDL